MRKKVEHYLNKWQMLSPGDVVIVGVSGGADSVCLLVLLEQLQKVLDFSMIAVHVHHGIRGIEADRDEAFVKKLCEERRIRCEVVHVDVPALAKEARLSEEEAGRNARRAVFQEIMQQYKGTKIALAHHQDDNAETFFLHLARGSKLKGLGGIYPVNGVYIRPLLCVGRKEIETYLAEKGIAYCMDATNLEDTYMRNRIRNHVIPFFQTEVNAKTVEHMNSTMEQLREVQRYLERQAKRALQESAVWNGQEVILLEEQFRCVESVLQDMILYQVLVQIAGKEKDLENLHLLSVKELFDKQTGKRLDLPYEMEAIRVYEGILLRKKKQEKPEIEVSSIEFGETGEWQFQGKTYRYRVFEWTGDLSVIPKKKYTKWFDYDIIKGTVDMRTRNQGDQIVIDAFGRKKKLKSYFVDEKIPGELRDQIPILAQKNEVLWIVGYRQSKAFQVSEKTKWILEITMDGGTSCGTD